MSTNSAPVGDICRVAIYDIPMDMVEYFFHDADPSVVSRIMYENELCVVTCSCHETALYLKNFMNNEACYYANWYVDADQTFEYPEEEREFEGEPESIDEDDYDRCVCGDLLDVFGCCRECDLGLRGINQYRYGSRF